MSTNIIEEINQLFSQVECDKFPKSTKEEFWKFVENRSLEKANKPNLKLATTNAAAKEISEVLKDTLQDEWIAFFQKRNQLYLLLTLLLVNQLKESSSETLFREKSLPISLLSKVWFKKDGKIMLERFKKPIFDIASSSSSLEINPDKFPSCQVKKNMKSILSCLETLLKIILDPACYTSEIHFVFKSLDKAASIKFSQHGYGIIGGILFLRLINPAILFPETYELISQAEITPYGRQALVYVGKILQVMANNSEFQSQDPFMFPANRFIRRHLPSWFSFFHELVTGAKLVTSAPLSVLPITPEDLIAKSNHDIYKTLICPLHLGKQKDIILHLFQLEKQMEGWKEEKRANCSFYFKKFAHTILSKYVIELPVTIEEFYGFLDHCQEVNFEEHCSRETKTVQYFNENLSVKHTKIKFPFPFTNRDFVSLNYREILPEDEFAISAFISIDRDDVPPEKEFVRGEIEGGFIVRAGSRKGTCSVTHIKHVNAKGWTNQTPATYLKKLVRMSFQKEIERILKYFKLNTA